MTTPRYTVGGVTGYGGNGDAGGRLGTTWYVYDSAYCYRIIRSFPASVSRGEHHARHLASLLNGEIEPPMPWDDPRHGTDNGYKNRGCRCPNCAEAHRLYGIELNARKAAA